MSSHSRFPSRSFVFRPIRTAPPAGTAPAAGWRTAGTHPDFKQVLSEAQCARYDVAYEPAENERSDAKKKLSREIRIHQIRVAGSIFCR